MVTASLRTTRSDTPATASEAPPIDVESSATQEAPTSAMDALGLGTEAAAPDAPTATPGPVATRPTQSVSRYQDLSSGGLVGEFNESDVKYPVIRIVNGSGELSKLYNQGTTLFGDEQLFPAPDPRTLDPKQVMQFVPVVLHKQYLENLTQEEVAQGVRARVVDTEQEVWDNGGTLNWNGKEKPSWQPSARMILLFAQPEGSAHPNFAIELAGKLWALAVFYASKSIYNHTAKLIFNAANSTLKETVLGPDGLPVRDERGYLKRRIVLAKKIWTWRCIKRAAGDFTVFGPEVRLTNTDTPAEVREFIDSVISVDSVPAE